MSVFLMPILAFDIVLVIAALDDVRRLRISNVLPLAMIALFGVHLIVNGMPPHLWHHALSFLLVLAGGVMLFAKGWLGGGDAKLLAATALWFDLSGLGMLIPAIAVVGGLTALLLVILRWMLPAGPLPGAHWSALRRRGPIPYAVPICVGSVMSLHILHG